METVMLDGREYTKANVVAKRFNYTADYLGQLCRGKRVDARVIGRSWFVNIDSLEGHQSKKYASLRKLKLKNTEDTASVVIHKQSGIAPKQYVKRVSMPLRNVHKSFDSHNKARLSEGAREVDVAYETDESSLLPAIKKNSKVTLLRVSPAGAERLNVKSSSSSVSTLAPEPLPEVYLKGVLSVQDNTDTYTYEEMEEISESRDNVVSKDEIDVTEHLNIEQKTPRALKVTIKRLSADVEKSIVAELLVNPDDGKAKEAANRGKYTYSVPIRKPADTKSEVSVTDLEHAPERGSSLPITVMVCSAVVMSLLLLSVENIIVVTTSTFDSSFAFQAASLLAFLHI